MKVHRMERNGLDPVAHVMMCGTGRALVKMANGHEPDLGELMGVIRVEQPIVIYGNHLIREGTPWGDRIGPAWVQDNDQLVGIVAVAYGGKVTALIDESDMVELLP